MAISHTATQRSVHLTALELRYIGHPIKRSVGRGSLRLANPTVTNESAVERTARAGRARLGHGQHRATAALALEALAISNRTAIGSGHHDPTPIVTGPSSTCA